MENTKLSVSDFIALTNQTLEYAYPTVVIEGEVSSFKVNQNKYVFFDLKDDQSSLGCFMTVWQLKVPIEDGMRVVVTASPKLTKWGKFSLTIHAIKPSGQGALKRSFDLLKQKLDKEGLFGLERKRALPAAPKHIAVISSTQAAGYADFIKIINDRWGGLTVDVAHVQVQGEVAAGQIIRAIQYFNSQEILPEALVIIRGGGSLDDLSVFNDEALVRAIAASRIPTMVGVGHEIDVTLADLVADVRAATPSNAAQLIVPDRREVIQVVHQQVLGMAAHLEQAIDNQRHQTNQDMVAARQQIEYHYQQVVDRLTTLRQIMQQLDPRAVLQRGYALIRGNPKLGATIEIETATAIMKAKVEQYDEKN